jgi:hypothetical protein
VQLDHGAYFEETKKNIPTVDRSIKIMMSNGGGGGIAPAVYVDVLSLWNTANPVSASKEESSSSISSSKKKAKSKQRSGSHFSRRDNKNNNEVDDDTRSVSSSSSSIVSSNSSVISSASRGGVLALQKVRERRRDEQQQQQQEQERRQQVQREENDDDDEVKKAKAVSVIMRIRQLKEVEREERIRYDEAALAVKEAEQQQQQRSVEEDDENDDDDDDDARSYCYTPITKQHKPAVSSSFSSFSSAMKKSSSKKNAFQTSTKQVSFLSPSLEAVLYDHKPYEETGVIARIAAESSSTSNAVIASMNSSATTSQRKKKKRRPPPPPPLLPVQNYSQNENALPVTPSSSYSRVETLSSVVRDDSEEEMMNMTISAKILSSSSPLYQDNQDQDQKTISASSSSSSSSSPAVEKLDAALREISTNSIVSFRRRLRNRN